MNKTVSEAVDYARALGVWAQSTSVEASVAVLPPFTALAGVADVLRRTDSRVLVQVGAQNMHWEDGGAFTGEISPLMIREAGATLVELGHYERRTACGETDVTVNRKVRSAIRHGLSVVVCIGEDEDTRDFGVVQEFVGMQLKIALHDVPAAALGSVVVAYEPGWAIGSQGTSASAEQIAAVHRCLRTRLEELYGAAGAAPARIVYGGSVTRETVPAYASIPDVDGLFIGRAAWEVADFTRIIEAFWAARAGRRVDA
jgi:triosephosphate isomerase